MNRALSLSTCSLFHLRSLAWRAAAAETLHRRRDVLRLLRVEQRRREHEAQPEQDRLQQQSGRSGLPGTSGSSEPFSVGPLASSPCGQSSSPSPSGSSTTSPSPSSSSTSTPAKGNLGDNCASADDCSEGKCLTFTGNDGKKHGFCTRQCTKATWTAQGSARSATSRLTPRACRPSDRARGAAQSSATSWSTW
ncbi:MAG: hypothetical protein U0235_21800 [Polyangiaceae bacterium]